MTGAGVLVQGLTSADMRRAVEHWFFRPLVRYLFHAEPKLSGLVLGVTEYYNDNWDQIFLRLFPTCAPLPRWPESFVAEHDHAEQPLGLTARQHALLVEGALKTLFGVDSGCLTDSWETQWRFAFESVIPEGTYAEKPWAELYFPYWTAVRHGSAEPEFRQADGLARGYAENRLSLLVSERAGFLADPDEAPPAPGVSPLTPEDWVCALEALNQVPSWESCLIELFRSASMLVASAGELHRQGAVSEAELRQREETELLQESLRHLADLFRHAGLLADDREALQLCLASEPGQLRLYGSSPAQLRKWFAAMYFAPLARLVLKSRPEAQVLTLHLSATAPQSGGALDERAVLGGLAQVDATADWNHARQILFGLSGSVVSASSLGFALGDLRQYADQPLIEYQQGSGEARWLCTQLGTFDPLPRRWCRRPGQARPQERQAQRVSEILSLLDRAEHFAAPLNACLKPCAAYLAQPSAELVWEIAAALPDLQFLLEVLGVDLRQAE